MSIELSRIELLPMNILKTLPENITRNADNLVILSNKMSLFSSFVLDFLFRLFIISNHSLERVKQI